MPSTHRKILHLDLDAFFCAVEELRTPELQGIPFAVGGSPNKRGVVASCSYAARLCGIHSAMPMKQAIKLCRELRIISPQYDTYHEMSEQVMAILRQRTALVEQLSIDEAFLDVSDLPQSGLQIAQELQAEIRQTLGLPCSLGVAANKLLAKTATDVGKSKHRTSAPPCAIEVVPPGDEAEYLAPLPVSALWGVGPKTTVRLADMGIRTIGDLTGVPEAVITRHFGMMGREMIRHAQGIDDRPVVIERSARSISSEVTFERDLTDLAALRNTLRRLSEEVGRSLRSKGLCAGTIRLKIRWENFNTHTRQKSLSKPTDQDNLIFETVLSLFESIWTVNRPVRLVGVGTTKLTERAHQLSLWDTSDQREHRLLSALDELRERFGENAVQTGRKLQREK